MKIKVIFAWYDMWIGFFFDMKKVKIYVFPIPMVGLEISLLPKGFYIDKVKSHWSPSPIYGEGGDLDTFILRRNDGGQAGAFKTLKKAIYYAKTLNHKTIYPPIIPMNKNDNDENIDFWLHRRTEIIDGKYKEEQSEGLNEYDLMWVTGYVSCLLRNNKKDSQSLKNQIHE